MNNVLKINLKNLNSVFYETLIYFIIITSFFIYENVNYKYYLIFYSPIYVTIAIFFNYLFFEINRKIIIEKEYIIVEKKGKSTKILKSEILETYHYKGKYHSNWRHLPFAHFEYFKFCTKNEIIIITNLRKKTNPLWKKSEKKVSFFNILKMNNPYNEKIELNENLKKEESMRIKKLSDKFESKADLELEKIIDSSTNEYTETARNAAKIVIKKRKANNA